MVYSTQNGTLVSIFVHLHWIFLVFQHFLQAGKPKDHHIDLCESKTIGGGSELVSDDSTESESSSSDDQSETESESEVDSSSSVSEGPQKKQKVNSGSSSKKANSQRERKTSLNQDQRRPK